MHFNADTAIKMKVEYWACSQEDNQNGNKQYHFSLKVSHLQKWLSVKKSISDSEIFRFTSQIITFQLLTH